MKRLAFYLFLLIYSFSFASFGAEEKSKDVIEGLENPRFGPGKAIEAFDKEQGFKLSSKAANAMKVSFEKLNQQSPWRVPKEAIINLKQSTGIYRKYNDWTSMVLVKILKREGDIFIVASEDLEKGDEIAISGANFLRMIDADLNSTTVDSCGH